MIETKPSPIRIRWGEIKQDNVKIEQPKGKAPKPIRMMVAASGVVRDMPTVAALSVGCKMYFAAISAKMIVGGTSISRVSHGANLQNVFISPPL